MMKQGILLIGLTGLLFNACIEHEVIPAPEPKADLECHFAGTINGTDIEFTENVSGYTHFTSKAKIVLPSPSPSSAVYFSQMASTQSPQSIKVGLGSAYWDAWLTAEPTLTIFNAFFNAGGNDTPNFSNDGTAGFEVTYRDASGREWKSSETSVNAQNVEFTGISQESDSQGDYSKFICNFDGYVYSLHPDSLAQTPPVLHLDSLPIQTGTLRGWFQR